MASAPPAEKMRRLSRVTANYNALQGLVLLPMGVLLLVVGIGWLWNSGGLLLTLGLVPALTVMALITRWYHRRFGRVRSTEMATMTLAALAGLAAFVGVGAGTSLLLSGQVHAFQVAGDGGAAPVWLGGVQVVLTLATMFLAGPLLRGRPGDLGLQRHWHLMLGGLLLLALVPVGLFTGGGHPLNTEALHTAGLMLAFGTLFIVGGLLDHRLLVRSLDASRAAVGEG